MVTLAGPQKSCIAVNHSMHVKYEHDTSVKDTEIVGILESEVEPDKEGVVNGGQHLFLSAHILYLLLSDDVTLVQDLYCTEQSHMTVTVPIAQVKLSYLIHYASTHHQVSKLPEQLFLQSTTLHLINLLANWFLEFFSVARTTLKIKKTMIQKLFQLLKD